MPSKRPHLPIRQSPELASVRTPGHRRRRLSDKIRVAFHTACDEGAVEIAERLLSQIDELVHHPPLLPAGIDRRQPERLTALCERLANLLLWRAGAGWSPWDPSVGGHA